MRLRNLLGRVCPAPMRCTGQAVPRPTLPAIGRQSSNILMSADQTLCARFDVSELHRLSIDELGIGYPYKAKGRPERWRERIHVRPRRARPQIDPAAGDEGDLLVAELPAYWPSMAL